MDSLFQVPVENSSDASVMLNGDGTVRFASEPSARLLGYTLEERQGHSAFELIQPDDGTAARQAFAECRRRPGVPLPVEYRVRHKDGVWRHSEAIAVNRLDDPAIGALPVNLRDVTDRPPP